MRHVFTRNGLFWTELSIFAHALIMRWRFNQHARSQVGNGINLPGKICRNVLLESVSRHEWQIQHGQFDDECVFTEKEPYGSIPTSTYLLDDIFIIRLEQIVFGQAFEFAKPLARIRWGPRRSWDPIMEVGWHIRNAAFHDNVFNVTSDNINGTPSWRSLNITAALNGKPVFGHSSGIIGIGDIPLLLSDIKYKLS